jgi:uncharacterized membrane protein
MQSIGYVRALSTGKDSRIVPLTRRYTIAEACFGVFLKERPPKAAYALPASGAR